MDAVGIPRNCYGPVLSSGEAGWLALRDRSDPWHAKLGDRAYLIGEAGDKSVLQDQPVERNGGSRRRQPSCCASARSAGRTRSRTMPALLAQAKALQLPMLCVNPDLEVLRGPNREICAGAIAARYAAIGGDVRYHGKPHRPIYDLSFERFPRVPPARILAVGDSLRTDIAGANATGIDSLFVTGGLLAGELGIAPLSEPPAAALDLAVRPAPPAPDLGRRRLPLVIPGWSGALTAGQRFPVSIPGIDSRHRFPVSIPGIDSM